MSVQVDQNGMFMRQGRPFLPLGFNYWPPESGVDCWTDAYWSIEPFQRDFQAMADMGFNCARIFLRWPEFQTREDRVEPVMLARLAEVGQAAQGAGITLIPTLFIGFMSGGLFPPPWLGERNLFTDPACITAAGLLATEGGRVLAPSDSVLAYDLSNEINVWCNHLPPVTTEEAIAWQRAMIDAIHAGHPGALVMNGTNHTGIVAEVPWNLRAQRQVPMDLLSMHVYPVRQWNPLKMASLRDYEADILAPVHVAMGRAYGPVMMQEFGVALPVSGRAPREYLFQSTIGCWLDGCNGFLQWGWQDFQTRAKPYRDNPFEKEICFLNSRGEVKEASKGFQLAADFIRAHADCTPEAPEIAIYLGDAYWEGTLATLSNSVRCFWLSAALRRAHLAHGFTETIDARYRALVIPGPRLNLDEIAALQRYVAGGGRVLLANVGYNYWCDDLKELADIDLVDMAHLPGEVPICGELYEFTVPPMEYFPVALPRGAAILATLNGEEIPAALVAENGDGPVATLFVPLGPELSEHPARLRYHELLAPIFAGWGMSPPAEGLPADIECRVLQNGAGERRLVLLNHSTTDFQGQIRWEGDDYPVKVPAKGVATVGTTVPAVSVVVCVDGE